MLTLTNGEQSSRETPLFTRSSFGLIDTRSASAFVAATSPSSRLFDTCRMDMGWPHVVATTEVLLVDGDDERIPGDDEHFYHPVAIAINRDTRHAPLWGGRIDEAKYETWTRYPDRFRLSLDGVYDAQVESSIPFIDVEIPGIRPHVDNRLAMWHLWRDLKRTEPELARFSRAHYPAFTQESFATGVEVTSGRVWAYGPRGSAWCTWCSRNLTIVTDLVEVMAQQPADPVKVRLRISRLAEAGATVDIYKGTATLHPSVMFYSQLHSPDVVFAATPMPMPMTSPMPMLTPTSMTSRYSSHASHSPTQSRPDTDPSWPARRARLWQLDQHRRVSDEPPEAPARHRDGRLVKRESLDPPSVAEQRLPVIPGGRRILDGSSSTFIS